MNKPDVRFKGIQLFENKMIVIDDDDSHSKAILQEDLDKNGSGRCEDDGSLRGDERLDR